MGAKIVKEYILSGFKTIVKMKVLLCLTVLIATLANAAHPKYDPTLRPECDICQFVVDYVRNHNSSPDLAAQLCMKGALIRSLPSSEKKKCQQSITSNFDGMIDEIKSGLSDKDI